jgi:hypothetical protein
MFSSFIACFLTILKFRDDDLNTWDYRTRSNDIAFSYTWYCMICVNGDKMCMLQCEQMYAQVLTIRGAKTP